MIEIIAAWPWEWQIAFLFGLAILAVIALYIVVNGIVTLVRGYPITTTITRNTGITATECQHDDNLTGECIKPGDNCATQAECDAEIKKRTPLPTVEDKQP